jgi:hypothetical protein
MRTLDEYDIAGPDIRENVTRQLQGVVGMRSKHGIGQAVAQFQEFIMCGEHLVDAGANDNRRQLSM